MKSLRWINPMALLICAATAGCGDDDGAAQSDSGAGGHPSSANGGHSGDAGKTSSSSGGTFRATIDGKPWEAIANRIKTRVDDDIPGGYHLEGNDGQATQVMLELYYIDEPGRYDLGVSGSVIGASGSVGKSPSVWQTPATGDAGVLRVTTLSAKRIAGTFEMQLTNVPGSAATGMITVTEGEFDLPLPGSAAPIEAGDGRSAGAQLDGERFNAATVVLTPAKDGIAFNMLNDDYNIGFVLGGVSEPGTYALGFEPPARSVVVVAGSKGDKTHCCWGASPDDSGSITFTTLDADRLAGTFDLDLQPQATSNATSPLTIHSGTFDIGRTDH